MKKLIPVESNPHLARDPGSNAVLNVDRAGYVAFMEQKRRRASREEELHTQLNTLKSELDSIRRVVQQLLAAQGNSQ